MSTVNMKCQITESLLLLYISHLFASQPSRAEIKEKVCLSVCLASWPLAPHCLPPVCRLPHTPSHSPVYDRAHWISYTDTTTLKARDRLEVSGYPLWVLAKYRTFSVSRRAHEILGGQLSSQSTGPQPHIVPPTFAGGGVPEICFCYYIVMSHIHSCLTQQCVRY